MTHEALFGELRSILQRPALAASPYLHESIRAKWRRQTP